MQFIFIDETGNNVKNRSIKSSKYGSIQVIAGNAISHIEALELPYSEEDEEEN